MPRPEPSLSSSPETSAAAAPGAWLAAKRQELQARRTLERLDHVRLQLLESTEWDAAAFAMGLELTRPAGDQFHYQNDRALARLLERQQNLSAQVLEKQRAFRQQCLDGRRQVDLDFTPGRKLTVQLLAVDAPANVGAEPPSAPAGGAPQQEIAVTLRRRPEMAITTRRLPRPWLQNVLRDPTQ